MSTGKIELSVGAVKIGDKHDIFTEEEIDNINNKIPELDERVGVIEDEIEEINSSLDNKVNYYLTAKQFELSESEFDFYELLRVAKEKGLKEVKLESKTYIFNNPLKIEDIRYMKFIGSGQMCGTTFKFNNSLDNEVFLTLGVVGGQQYSSMTSFENIYFIDENSNSVCFKIIGSQISGAQANWKNYFSNCQIRNFKVGCIFDTVTPEIPSTHGYGSETMFFNCKFKNNRTTIITRNYQAVNTHFIATDIENDDSNECYTFIEAQCGIGIDFNGGSFIGKGKLLVLKSAYGSTHPSSSFTFRDLRFELWAGHNGVLIDEDQSYINYNEMLINFENCSFTNFNQSIDFIRYSSRLTLLIDSCKCLAGKMTIKHYPTIGRSGVVYSNGQYGEVKINRSLGFDFEKQRTSPYGTYDGKYRNRISINDSFSNSNGNNELIDGFFSLKNANSEELGMDFGMCSFKNIIFNNDVASSGFKDVKAILPKYARPCKFFLYKQPIRWNNPIIYKLYIVKDKSFWTTSEFNLDTDAVLVSTIDTTNKTGYFESVINLPNGNDIGYVFQSGVSEGSQNWSWNEGRICIKWENLYGNSFAGFVGVTYI